MGWFKKIAASGILVVVGISVSSSVFAASRYSNFFAPAGYSALGATVSEWDTGDVEWSFADATTASVSFGNVMVPADATGVTSIKVYYRATNASTTNIYVRFYFTEYENDGTAPAYDQDAAATLSVAGGSNVIRFVTVPSTNNPSTATIPIPAKSVPEPEPPEGVDHDKEPPPSFSNQPAASAGRLTPPPPHETHVSTPAPSLFKQPDASAGIPNVYKSVASSNAPTSAAVGVDQTNVPEPLLWSQPPAFAGNPISVGVSVRFAVKS